MSLRSPARLALVVVAVSLAAAAAGWFLLVSGQKSKASSVQADLDAANVALVKKRTEVDSVRGIAGVAPPKVLERALPDETPMADVITELSDLADQSGVEFSSLTPGPPVALQGFSVTPLTTEFGGDWSEVSSFVAKVRRLVKFTHGTLRADGRLYSIRKIDLGEGEGKFPHLKAGLTLDVFQYGTASGSTPAGQPATTSTAAPASS